MSCGSETECFTITWEIENFSTFSPAGPFAPGIRSPVWKTETTEDNAWWRFFLKPTDLDLEFQLISFESGLKESAQDYKYELSVLTSSGEGKLRNRIFNDCCCCSYKIEKSKIFGETSDSFLLNGTLTLYCRIWLQKLKPGRCFLRTALHEVDFSWVIEGFSSAQAHAKRSFLEQEKLLLTTILYKVSTEERSTHCVRVELHPDYGKWSTFIDCRIDIGDRRGQAICSSWVYPVTGWEWDVLILPEQCSDGPLRLEFYCFIAVDEEHPTPPDAAEGSSSTLSRDLLQLYRKKTFSDATLNTEEDTSLSTHKNLLAARSRVFEGDETAERCSGVVDIGDFDSETMDRLLAYPYSDSLIEELRWEQVSALYYAADKYAVLPLKRECAQVLMVAMAADNVCDVLVLADRHSDEPLMSCAVDFVRFHQEVLSSPAWENLEKSNSINDLRLTTKVLRQIFLPKDKK